MRIFDFINKWFITNPPVISLKFETVLVSGFKPTHRKVDVFPYSNRKSYHTVVIKGEESIIAASYEYEYLYNVAERLVYIDGLHVNKESLSLKEEDAIVWWGNSISKVNKSTIIMKKGWHSKCNQCGECCSHIARVKNKTILESLNYPCYICHSGKEMVSCPYLEILGDKSSCLNYETRPSCCRSYPARDSSCQFITPT